MIKHVSKDEYEIINSLSQYNVSIDDPFINVYGYYVDNELVGFIDYSIMYDKAELNYIFVLEDYRDKGIASILMDNMMSNIIESGVVTITLEVCVTNVCAIRLYNKYGFNTISIREKYYDGVDGLLMYKKMGD